MRQKCGSWLCIEPAKREKGNSEFIPLMPPLSVTRSVHHFVALLDDRCRELCRGPQESTPTSHRLCTHLQGPPSMAAESSCEATERKRNASLFLLPHDTISRVHLLVQRCAKAHVGELMTNAVDRPSSYRGEQSPADIHARSSKSMGSFGQCDKAQTAHDQLVTALAHCTSTGEQTDVTQAVHTSRALWHAWLPKALAKPQNDSETLAGQQTCSGPDTCYRTIQFLECTCLCRDAQMHTLAPSAQWHWPLTLAHSWLTRVSGYMHAG